MVSRTRGRPPKFGRPARLVALTLPQDTITHLQSIDPDVARAVVSLVDQSQGRTSPPDTDWEAPVTLARVSEHRALIVIDPSLFREIPGCALIPLTDRRAFLALSPGHTLADVELSVADLLEDPSIAPTEREALEGLRRALREWRRDEELTFHTRSIVLVERRAGWQP
jgi:hypothetical protein